MLHLNAFVRIAPVVAALVAMAVPAAATVIAVDTDRTDWDNNVTGANLVDFSTLGIGPGGFQNFAAGLVIDDLTFFGRTNGSGDLWVNHPTAGAPDNFGTEARLRGPSFGPGVNRLEITLASPVTAFALDMASWDPEQLSLRLELSTGEVFVVQAEDAPPMTFWGVRTDDPFDFVTVTLQTGTGGSPGTFASYGLFDNFAYGEAGAGMSETPEVTTFLYGGTGLLLLALTWFRRKVSH